MVLLQKLKQITLCGIWLLWLWSSVFAVYKNDLLNKVTQDTRTYETIIDKEASDVFNDALWMKYDPKTWLEVEKFDSLIVKVTRFMLKLAVILAVPMIIYSGIKIVLSLWDEGKMKKALIEIVHVVVGVILALLAVMIIYIITSLTRGTNSAWLI
jgi:Type IV secretion system pilin